MHSNIGKGEEKSEIQTKRKREREKERKRESRLHPSMLIRKHCHTRNSPVLMIDLQLRASVCITCVLVHIGRTVPECEGQTTRSSEQCNSQHHTAHAHMNCSKHTSFSFLLWCSATHSDEWLTSTPWLRSVVRSATLAR